MLFNFQFLWPMLVQDSSEDCVSILFLLANHSRSLSLTQPRKNKGRWALRIPFGKIGEPNREDYGNHHPGPLRILLMFIAGQPTPFASLIHRAAKFRTSVTESEHDLEVDWSRSQKINDIWVAALMDVWMIIDVYVCFEWSSHYQQSFFFVKISQARLMSSNYDGCLSSLEKISCESLPFSDFLTWNDVGPCR